MTIWTLNIERAKGPRYRAIVESIEQAIGNGELQPGQKLPTHRDLARRLGVSVQTITNAYSEAERRGLVMGETGRGTFVQHIKRGGPSGYITDEPDRSVIDLSNLMPVVSDIHVEALKKTLGNLKREEIASSLLGYRPTPGLEPHRQGGAAWLNQNGVSVNADDVIVTNGVAHGIWIALASLTEPGDAVVTETLTDNAVITNAAILKLKLKGLPADEEGIVPDAFAEACEHESIKALCVTPCYNNPTVSLMSEHRREEIAAIARRHDVAIIEDDVFGPLIPNRPKPLWRFAPERTYYLSSYSKAITAALRTGYLTGPSQMMPRLVSSMRATGWMANTWTAETATKWLYDGTAEMLIDWQREKLKIRHGIFDRIMDGHDYAAHPHSIHVWLSLPEQWRSRDFVDQARMRGLLVTPPDPFVVGRPIEPHAIRIALGDTVREDKEFERGIRQLDALLREIPRPMSVHY